MTIKYTIEDSDSDAQGKILWYQGSEPAPVEAQEPEPPKPQRVIVIGGGEYGRSSARALIKELALRGIAAELQNTQGIDPGFNVRMTELNGIVVGRPRAYDGNPYSRGPRIGKGQRKAGRSGRWDGPQGRRRHW